MFTLLQNAAVLTMDPARPRARALLVGAGRLLALFDDPAPDLVLPGPLRRLDLGGAALLPSFTDSHIHFLDWGFALDRLDATATRSPEHLADRVAARLADRSPAERAAPLLGSGWLESDWIDAGGPPRSTAPLDAAAPDTPVVLTSRCTHQAWVNAAALALAGIGDATPDPPRGRIVRDPATRRPTGILQEDALKLLDRALPAAGPRERRAALQRALAAAHAAGITAVHCPEPEATFETYCAAARDGDLPLRVRFYLPGRLLEGARDFGLAAADAGGRVSLAGFKFFSDGSLGSRTAHMDAPYLGDGDGTNRGLPMLDPDELRAIVARATELRAELAIHAIGDAAVARVLDACEEARRLEADRWPGAPPLRHRIEHLQTIRPDDLARAARLGVWAAMQPVHLLDDWHAADRLLGDERAARCFRCRAVLDAGVRVAFGSDAPIATVSVPWSLHAAVTRRDRDGRRPAPDGWQPAERVTVAEALAAHTRAGAELAGDGATRGRLAPGCVADLVVLDRDPTAIDPAGLHALQVRATLLEGEAVFGGEWLAARAVTAA